MDGSKPLLQAAQKTKAISWLSSQKVSKFKEYWQAIGIGFEDKSITMQTELDFVETDAGLCEVFWRVLPEKTLAVPATLVRSLCEALDLPLEEGEGLTVTASAIQANEDSLAGVRAEFMQSADRADLLLVPVYGQNPGHWTLLAAQRTSLDPAAVVSPVASSSSKGCSDS